MPELRPQGCFSDCAHCRAGGEVKELRLGSTTVQQVVELDRWVFPPKLLFPALTDELIEEARATLDAGSVDPDTGDFLLSVHSYVVRTKHQVILIDSCNGNDKPAARLPDRPPAQNSLPRTAGGGRPAPGGRRPRAVHPPASRPRRLATPSCATATWVPTFPNARYVMGELEFQDMKNWYETGRRSHPLDNDLASSFEDSVLPVVDSGQAVFVEQGHAIEQDSITVCAWRAPLGHTRGHAAVHIEGAGVHAVATGDAFHHLIQLNHPELPQGADVDVTQSTATRRRLFAQFADTDTIVLPGHFPAPTAGRIVEQQGKLGFQFMA